MPLILALFFSLAIFSCGRHESISHSDEGTGKFVEVKAEFLSEVILNEDLDTLKKYIDEGGDVNFELRSGRTLLTEACQWEKLLIIEFLISKNADRELQDKEGKSAKDYGVENIKIKRLLYPALVTEQKNNLIDLALKNNTIEFKKVLEDNPPINFYILYNELKINYEDFEGDTFLTFLIKNKKEMFVRLLAQPKFELNSNLANLKGESPLFLSRKLNLKNTEKLLLKLGARE